MLAIIDYGMGNLRSVQKALERTGHAAEITSDPGVAGRAAKLVLPGVGAFGDAARALRQRGLAEPILASIAAGRPFLGICLGLQLLFETSDEDAGNDAAGREGDNRRGLGVLPGRVVRFDLPGPYKVPHMGWNQLAWPGGGERSGVPIFAGVAAGEHFYFVHSYHVVPDNPSHAAAQADYGGPFCAAVSHGNIYACQFHPEKSQAAGLRVLKNFAELA
ncbi:MAG: imidazole glycerol phosphate synthase subunit HisH [Planctomycetota bacterium]